MRKKERVPGANYERGYVYNFHYHLIFVTKYRQAMFTTLEVTQEMTDILLHIAEIADIEVEAIEVMPDHVHMLISFKPKYAPANVVKNIKGSSARIFFKNHPDLASKKMWGGHLWSKSYYMSTVGTMSKEVVETYIRNQCTK